jgi:hypothetical protein
MRVNLIARSNGAGQTGLGSIPVSLKIRPSSGVADDYEYATDSASLLWMLRRETDLPDSVIEHFHENMQTAFHSHLLGVELNERVLTDIGYFG